MLTKLSLITTGIFLVGLGLTSQGASVERIEGIISKSPRTFGYLKNTWSIRLLATYLTTILGMNVSPMQTWRTY